MASNNFNRFGRRMRSDDDNIAEKHHKQERCTDFRCLARILEKSRAQREAQILSQTKRLRAAERARTNAVRERLRLPILRDPLSLAQLAPAGPRKRPQSPVQGQRLRPGKYLPLINAEVVTKDRIFRTQRHQKSPATQVKDAEEVSYDSEFIHSPQPPKAPRSNLKTVTLAPPPALAPTPAPPPKPAPPTKREPRFGRSLRPAKTVSQDQTTDNTSELGLLYPDIEEEWRRILQNKRREQREKEERKRLAQSNDWNQLPHGQFTSAKPRPSAYIPQTDLLCLPKPYGAQSPFKPSLSGATMRHFRKPTVKPIDI